MAGGPPLAVRGSEGEKRLKTEKPGAARKATLEIETVERTKQDILYQDGLVIKEGWFGRRAEG